MNFFDAELIDNEVKIFPVQMSFFGIFLAFFFYINNSKFLFLLKKNSFGLKAYNFLNKKLFFDKLYQEFISQYVFIFGYSTSYKLVDRGIFEVMGPYGLNYIISKTGSDLQKLQSGYLYHYTFIFLVIISLILIFEHIVLLESINSILDIFYLRNQFS